MNVIRTCSDTQYIITDEVGVYVSAEKAGVFGEVRIKFSTKNTGKPYAQSPKESTILTPRKSAKLPSPRLED